MEITNNKPPVNFSDNARAKRSADADDSSAAAVNAGADRKAAAKAENAPPRDPPKEAPRTDGARGRKVDVTV